MKISAPATSSADYMEQLFVQIKLNSKLLSNLKLYSKANPNEIQSRRGSELCTVLPHYLQAEASFSSHFLTISNIQIKISW